MSNSSLQDKEWDNDLELLLCQGFWQTIGYEIDARMVRFINDL